MKTIISVIGAILLAIFVGWINARNNKNRLANASEEFINIITKELEDFYPIPQNWPDNIDLILQSKVRTLQVAAYNFRKALPWHQKMSFSKTWEKFHNPTGREVNNNSRFNHYCDGNNKTERFKKNIDDLLSFAKYE